MHDNQTLRCQSIVKAFCEIGLNEVYRRESFDRPQTVRDMAQKSIKTIADRVRYRVIEYIQFIDSFILLLSVSLDWLFLCLLQNSFCSSLLENKISNAEIS